MIQNYLHGVTRTSLKVTAKHGSRMKNSLQPDKTLSFMESSVGDLPLQFVKRVKSSLVHINETFINPSGPKLNFKYLQNPSSLQIRIIFLVAM